MFHLSIILVVGIIVSVVDAGVTLCPETTVTLLNTTVGPVGTASAPAERIVRFADPMYCMDAIQEFAGPSMYRLVSVRVVDLQINAVFPDHLRIDLRARLQGEVVAPRDIISTSEKCQAASPLNVHVLNITDNGKAELATCDSWTSGVDEPFFPHTQDAFADFINKNPCGVYSFRVESKTAGGEIQQIGVELTFRQNCFEEPTGFNTVSPLISSKILHSNTETPIQVQSSTTTVATTVAATSPPTQPPTETTPTPTEQSTSATFPTTPTTSAASSTTPQQPTQTTPFPIGTTNGLATVTKPSTQSGGAEVVTSTNGSPSPTAPPTTSEALTTTGNADQSTSAGTGDDLTSTSSTSLDVQRDSEAPNLLVDLWYVWVAVGVCVCCVLCLLLALLWRSRRRSSEKKVFYGESLYARGSARAHHSSRQQSRRISQRTSQYGKRSSYTAMSPALPTMCELQRPKDAARASSRASSSSTNRTSRRRPNDMIYDTVAPALTSMPVMYSALPADQQP